MLARLTLRSHGSVLKVEPGMARLLPHRAHRGGKLRVRESPHGNAIMPGKKIGLPIDGGPAFGTKMDAQFTPVLPIADVHPGLAAWLDLGLGKIRTYTEH